MCVVKCILSGARPTSRQTDVSYRSFVLLFLWLVVVSGVYLSCLWLANCLFTIWWGRTFAWIFLGRRVAISGSACACVNGSRSRPARIAIAKKKEAGGSGAVGSDFLIFLVRNCKEKRGCRVQEWFSVDFSKDWYKEKGGWRIRSIREWIPDCSY